MTSTDRFERLLPAALTDLADPRTPDYLADVLGQTAGTRQRRAWASLERWLPMTALTTTRQVRTAPWRQVALLALLALTLAAIAIAVVGSRRAPAPIFGLAANGLITYSVDGDLFTGDQDTGESTALLAGQAYDSDAWYSRDGLRIAFRRRADPAVDGAEFLMVMNADGSGLKAISATPLTGIEWFDWSPHGETVMVVHETDGPQVLQLLDANGIEAPVTLDTGGLRLEGPVFRPPDGAEILFRGEEAPERVGVFVMNADGTNLRTLISPIFDPNSFRQPRYSPDGQTIAFNRWDGADGIMRLYVMNADGSGEREVATRPDIHYMAWPVWSNDGKRLAVQIAHSPGNIQRFAVIDVASGEIVETGPDVTSGEGGAIEWSPDDTQLLLVPNAPGSSQLLLDPNGGPWTEAPWDTDSYPAWQRLAPRP